MVDAPLLSVLIVDDNEDIRDVLRLLFELDGFDVVGEASNGLDAVTLGRRFWPDFVVLDSQMPVHNGQAIADVLHAIVPATKIIGFSGSITKQPDWADRFLTKDRLAELSPLLHPLVDLA